MGGHCVRKECRASPSGCGHNTGDGASARRGCFEFGDATSGADALNLAMADDGLTGGVISAIFEFLEPFDEAGNDVLACC